MAGRTPAAGSKAQVDPIRVRFAAFELDEANASLLCDGGPVALAPTQSFHVFDGKFGLFLMAVVMLFVGFAYLGAVRHTDRRDPDSAEQDTPVSQSPRNCTAAPNSSR